MSIYLTHTTALAYWLTRLMDAVLPAKITARLPQAVFDRTLGDAGYGSDAVRRAREFMVACGAWLHEEAANRTVHLAVPLQEQRRAGKAVAYHCMCGMAPEGAFCKVAEDVYVASPPYCFLQLAAMGLEIYELVEAGTELCAAYGVQPCGQGFAGRRVPLCDVASIDHFLDGVPGRRGTARAREALQWVTENSFSPMETSLLVELRLPMRLGGRGFPGFMSNAPVQVDDPELRKLIGGKRFVRGDIVLAGLMAVIEYDSYEEHMDRWEFDQTQTRANVLRALGYTVISLTYGQVAELERFDTTVWAIEEQLGLVHPQLTRHELCLQREVHDFLLAGDRSRF